MSDPLENDLSRRKVLDNQDTINQYLSALLKNDLSGAESMMDWMTGMSNIRGFYYNGARLLAENLQVDFALVRIDIHNFKLVNEFIGRKEGDKLIIYIGNMLKEYAAGELWEASHFRADTFAFIMPYKEKSEIDDIIEQMHQKIQAYPIHCSILPFFGVCLIEDHSEHIDVLCDCANIALDTVKGNVLKHCAYYTEKIKEQIAGIKHIETRMNDAMRQKEFCAYLQPKVDMLTGEVIGAEALVRWINPDLGVIPPNDYVGIFESNGFIINMDEIVWEIVFSTLHEWKEKGYRLLPISINVSRVHAVETAFAEKIIALSKQYEIPPRYVKLELTESAFMNQSTVIYESMEQLRNYGFEISMDDFGCGYSSLNMLQTVDIDELKLDRMFLSELGKNEKSSIIIRHAIQMTKDIHVDILAEGVETEEQRDFLLSCGCRHAQGFLYYKPMPIKEFEEKFIVKASS